MDANEMRSLVIDRLLDTPYAKKVDAEHIVVRCPICGDSKKHHDGAHCNIWFRDDQPLIYHCWICEESGLVDREFLNDKGIHDSEVIASASQYNRQYGRKGRSSKISYNGEIQNIEIPKILPKDDRKVEYIRKRLGINFTYESLEAMRVITSIKDFLLLNKLQPNPSYTRVLDTLESDYIGFLSISKGYIIFRSINPKNKFRYINYRVFPEILTAEKFYTMPSRADILAEDVTLHITEGIFDIISVFFNIGEAQVDNHIYAAVCGSGYLRVLEYFLRKGMIGNLTVNIYSDLDKKPYFYNNINDMQKWYKGMKLFYNTVPGEKDFGVSADKIKPKQIVVKNTRYRR